MSNEIRRSSPFRIRSKYSRELLTYASEERGLVARIFDKFSIKPLSSQLSHDDQAFLKFIHSSEFSQEFSNPSSGRKATIRELAIKLSEQV